LGFDTLGKPFSCLAGEEKHPSWHDNTKIADASRFIHFGLEFTKIQEMVQISLIKAAKDDGCSLLRLIPFDDFEYGEWHHQLVEFNNFHLEIKCKASQYLNELHKMDVKWLDTKNITKLKALLSYLS